MVRGRCEPDYSLKLLGKYGAFRHFNVQFELITCPCIVCLDPLTTQVDVVLCSWKIAPFFKAVWGTQSKGTSSYQNP